MFKESSEKLVGNDAFEGYAIDLIYEIAQILSKSNLGLSFSIQIAVSCQSSTTHSNGLMMEPTGTRTRRLESGTVSWGSYCHR